MSIKSRMDKFWYMLYNRILHSKEKTLLLYVETTWMNLTDTVSSEGR